MELQSFVEGGLEEALVESGFEIDFVGDSVVDDVVDAEEAIEANRSHQRLGRVTTNVAKTTGETLETVNLRVGECRG